MPLSKVPPQAGATFFAAYELCGTGLISHTEQGIIAGKVMGKMLTPKLIKLSWAVDEFVEMKYDNDDPHLTQGTAPKASSTTTTATVCPATPKLLKWIIGQELPSFHTWVGGVAGGKSKI